MKGSGSRLAGLTKELRAQWLDTKNYWKDAKSQEFEKRFIEDLMTGVSAAMTNIDALERVLNKIRDDCE